MHWCYKNDSSYPLGVICFAWKATQGTQWSQVNPAPLGTHSLHHGLPGCPAARGWPRHPVHPGVPGTPGGGAERLGQSVLVGPGNNFIFYSFNP